MERKCGNQPKRRRSGSLGGIEKAEVDGERFGEEEKGRREKGADSRTTSAGDRGDNGMDRTATTHGSQRPFDALVILEQAQVKRFSKCQMTKYDNTIDRPLFEGFVGAGCTLPNY